MPGETTIGEARKLVDRIYGNKAQYEVETFGDLGGFTIKDITNDLEFYVSLNSSIGPNQTDKSIIEIIDLESPQSPILEEIISFLGPPEGVEYQFGENSTRLDLIYGNGQIIAVIEDVFNAKCIMIPRGQKLRELALYGKVQIPFSAPDDTPSQW